MLLSACKSEYQAGDMDGADTINWKDAYLEQIFSQVFHKPGNQISYEEIRSVEKISRVYQNENGGTNIKISVQLSDAVEPEFVKEPEKPKEAEEFSEYRKKILAGSGIAALLPSTAELVTANTSYGFEKGDFIIYRITEICI